MFAIAGTASFLVSAIYAVRPILASGPSSNRVLNYQIRLTDASGIPTADGTKNIKLSFYDAASGGTRLATDCGTTVTPVARKAVFTNGTASVLLGDTAADGTHNCADGSAPNALPSSLFSNPVLYLGITVGADAEMTPRKRIVAQGYALNADLLDDLDTSNSGGSVAFIPATDGSGNLTLTKNLTVDTPTFVVDSANDRVGMGTAAPSSRLQVTGITAVTGDYLVDSDGSAYNDNGYFPAVISEGAPLVSAAAAGLCTDSLTTPTKVYKDGNGDCTPGNGGSDAVLVNDSAGATVPVTSAWAFNDADTDCDGDGVTGDVGCTASDGIYQDGQDLYVDRVPSLAFNSPNLGVGTSAPQANLHVVGTGVGYDFAGYPAVAAIEAQSSTDWSLVFQSRAAGLDKLMGFYQDGYYPAPSFVDSNAGTLFLASANVIDSIQAWSQMDRRTAVGLFDTWSTLAVRSDPDKAGLTGTTTANASTTVTGVGTMFYRDLGVGDRISLSSAPTAYATVTAIASDTSLTVDTPLGDGTSQTINRKSGIARFENSAGGTVLSLNDEGKMGVGTLLPDSQLTVGQPALPIGSIFSGSDGIGVSKTLTAYGTAGQFQAVWDFPSAGFGITGTVSVAQTRDTNANNMTGVMTGMQGIAEHLGAGTATEIVGGQGSAYDRVGGVTTDAIGLWGNTVAQTATITNAVGIQGENGIFSSGAITNAYAVAARQSTLASGTITGNVGLQVDDFTVGTNKTDVLIGTRTIPAGNYSLYNASSYASAFAGDVGIGTTTPVAKLDVRTAQGGAGAGTISSSGTSVTGTGTSFTTQLRVGSRIVDIAGSSEGRRVTAIASDTSLTVDSAFTTDLSGATFRFTNPGVYAGPDGSIFSTTAALAIEGAEHAFASYDDTSLGTLSVTERNDGTVGIPTYALGGYNVASNSSGTLGRTVGAMGGAVAVGAGGVDQLIGTGGNALNYGSGTVTDEISLLAQANVNGGGGTVTNNYGLYIESQGGVGTNNYQLYSASTAPFVIRSSGDVGIGTAAPAFNLDISGSSGIRVTEPSAYGLTLKSTDVTSDFMGIRWRDNADAALWSMGNDFNGTGNQDFWLYDNVNGRTVLLADQSGTGYLSFGTTNGGFEYDNVAQQLHVFTSGTNKVFVNSTGEVGIGDSTPASLLTVGSGDRFNVNASGDVTSTFTTLDGSTTTNGTGTNSTSLVVNSGTNFNDGNYVKVASAACVANPCYAKIVSGGGTTTLVISPALSWNNADAVTEVHVPEVGGVDTVQTLANRYGRGYFIDGVVTGNGSTSYSDGKIESASTLFVNAAGNQPVTFGSGAVTVGGNLSVTGTLSSGGSVAFVNGGNSLGASATLGTNDNFPLSMETNGTTRMTLDTSGNLGLGTTTPGGVIHIVTESASPMMYDRYGGAPPNIIFRRANGTIASPTAVTADNQLFAIGGRGYGATGFSASGRAAMFGAASETWTDTAQGAYLAFNTTAIGTAAAAERMRISDAGNLGIGSSAPAARLTVSGGDALVTNGNLITPFGGQGGYENYIMYSDQIDNGAWVKTGVTVTADATTAPDGSTGADQIAGGAIATDGVKEVANNPYTMLVAYGNKTWTGSVWLRANAGTPSVTLKLDSNGTSQAFTQAVTLSTSWQRYSITATYTTGSGYPIFEIQTGTNTVFAWGAQIEYASAPGVYARTESVPVATSDAATVGRGFIGNGSFLVSGTLADAPTAGAGGRLMWVPNKQAFRAGYVAGSNWDDSNLGQYSAAFGNDTKASGFYSFAGGNQSTSTSTNSFAYGAVANATGFASVALGSAANASGSVSVALGGNAFASGGSAMAFGSDISASSTLSIAFGHYVNANVDHAMVIGHGVDTVNRLSNNDADSLMVGFNSTVPTLFVGTSGGVGATGSVGIGSSTKLSALTVTPTADVSNIGGTTTASASTTITGAGTAFLTSLGIGDRISLSSAPSTYATVTAIASDTSLTVDAALGNGTSQTINKKASVFRLNGASGAAGLVVNDQGFLGINDITPANQLSVVNSVVNGAAPVKAEYVNGSTNTAQTVMTVLTTSTGDMVDGFGPLVEFKEQDNAGLENLVGQIGFTRDGADNSGKFRVFPTNGGVPLSSAFAVTWPDAIGAHVGVNTATPDSALHVQVANSIGTVPSQIHIQNTTNHPAADAGIWFDTANQDFNVGIDETNDSFVVASGTTISGGTPRFTVDASGKIGIGTTSPNSLLNVETAAGAGLSTYLGPLESSFSAEMQGYIDTGIHVVSALNSGGTGRLTSLMAVNEDNDATADVQGVYGFALANHASGTKNFVMGMESDAESFNAGTTNQLMGIRTAVGQLGAGTVGSANGIRVASNYRTAGTVTLNAGVFVEDQSGVANVATDNYQIYSQNGSGFNFVVRADGRVGIGTNAPSTRLYVYEDSATVASFDRKTNDGTLIDLLQDSVSEGSISVSGNTVSYNAFTGSHYAWTDSPPEKGMLVTLTGDNRRLHDRADGEMLYGVALASQENDPKVLGSYLALQNPAEPASDDNPHLVMAVGNGDVWVVDSGEDIAAGDFLIASGTPGHAMKDPGTDEVSHIVARAAEPVDWGAVTEFAPDGRKHKLVSVTFDVFASRNVYPGPFGAPLSELTVSVTDFDGHDLVNVRSIHGIADVWSISEDGILAAKDVVTDAVTLRQTDAKTTLDRAAVPAGKDYVQVHNPAITPDSRVFVTMKKNPGSQWWVDEVGEGFLVVKTAQPVVEDIPFDYWLVDTVDMRTPAPAADAAPDAAAASVPAPSPADAPAPAAASPAPTDPAPTADAAPDAAASSQPAPDTTSPVLTDPAPAQ